MPDDQYLSLLISSEGDKAAGKIDVIMEGKTSAETIKFTETATSMKFTWPDEYSATISIS